jgi:hypothetical protein
LPDVLQLRRGAGRGRRPLRGLPHRRRAVPQGCGGHGCGRDGRQVSVRTNMSEGAQRQAAAGGGGSLGAERSTASRAYRLKGKRVGVSPPRLSRVAPPQAQVTMEMQAKVGEPFWYWARMGMMLLGAGVMTLVTANMWLYGVFAYHDTADVCVGTYLPCASHVLVTVSAFTTYWGALLFSDALHAATVTAMGGARTHTPFSRVVLGLTDTLTARRFYVDHAPNGYPIALKMLKKVNLLLGGALLGVLFGMVATIGMIQSPEGSIDRSGSIVEKFSNPGSVPLFTHMGAVQVKCAESSTNALVSCVDDGRFTAVSQVYWELFDTCDNDAMIKTFQSDDCPPDLNDGNHQCDTPIAIAEIPTNCNSECDDDDECAQDCAFFIYHSMSRDECEAVYEAKDTRTMTYPIYLRLADVTWASYYGKVPKIDTNIDTFGAFGIGTVEQHVSNGRTSWTGNMTYTMLYWNLFMYSTAFVLLFHCVAIVLHVVGVYDGNTDNLPGRFDDPFMDPTAIFGGHEMPRRAGAANANANSKMPGAAYSGVAMRMAQMGGAATSRVL